MQSKFAHLFLCLAGIVLLAAAVAKLVSSFGSAKILQNPDPVIGLAFRNVFRVVGAMELAIALACLFGRRIKLRAGLVAWLATTIFAYRFDLVWIGYQKPCSCLGNLTDALHMAMKIILAYLLVGSYATLFWLWRQRKKTIPASTPA